MEHDLTFKTKDSGDTLLGKTKAEVILLCYWYSGLTASLADQNKIKELKRMELLN